MDSAVLHRTFGQVSYPPIHPDLVGETSAILGGGGGSVHPQKVVLSVMAGRWAGSGLRRDSCG